MIKNLLTTFFILFVFIISAQESEQILFSVDGKDVSVSEFDYIYNKNNGDHANYSKKSLEEYLDLYIKFKLKVARAREMGLDTLSSLKNELAGYRKQLADSYLVDNEVSDQLVKQVFDRKKFDLRIRHIMVKKPNGIIKENKNMNYSKIQKIHNLLADGTDFIELAKQMSEDKQSAINGGDLGFFTSMLPDGLYELENAAYNLDEGDFSDIVTTDFGYHIVYLEQKRPARGEMEAAHILIKKNRKGLPNRDGQKLIDSIYKVVKNGGTFEELAKLHSEDKTTASQGGYLGVFGINKYHLDFENVAFSLEKDGEISKPISTSIGWHIVKRIAKHELQDFETAKKRLKNKIAKASRFDIAKQALIEKIKENGQLKENKDNLDRFVNSLDEHFLSYKWTPKNPSKDILFSFNNGMESSISDFATYCKKNSRVRLRFDKKMPAKDAAYELYKLYLDTQTLSFEEANLENKYPEFKALMREYSEGILLFEATEKEVWSKASKDSIGLEAYFSENKEKYSWNERAILDKYVSDGTQAKQIKETWEVIKNNNPSEVKSELLRKQINVKYEEVTLDKDHPDLSKINWKINQTTDPQVDLSKKQLITYKIKEILAASPKTLQESKGYVISDYQDQLEKEWIAELKQKFTIEVNESVFNSLIKN